MKAIDRSAVEDYCRDDWVLARLDSASRASDETLTSQRWLRDSPGKRAVFAALYGDLFSSRGLRVLDIGGGVTAFTRILGGRHDYTLVDLMAHECRASPAVASATEGCSVATVDWATWPAKQTFDVIVANDLFPNVDQRLELFVRTMLPRCGHLRLSLTYYLDGRWYVTSRVDADEIMTIVAWDGRRTADALRPYLDRVEQADLALLQHPMESAWKNGRQVCVVRLNG
jgi:trans-aconitate methyltransferase